MIATRLTRAGLLVLALAGMVQGSDFVTGQAARAVFGQSSFSSHEAGVNGIALSTSSGKLFVGDAAGKVSTFDLTRIGSVRDDVRATGSTCLVCVAKASASIAQRVSPAMAAVASVGKTEAIIDTRNKQILLWRDVTVPSAAFQPDIVLHAGEPSFLDPISVTLDGKRLFVGDAALHRVLVWNSLPVKNDQLPDAVLGSTASDGALTADVLQRPEALASDGSNLFVADSVTHRVLVFAAGDVRLRSDQIIHSATLLPSAFAGGTLISISGSALSESTQTAIEDGSAPLPHKLGGVEVVFNGTALPLVSVSPEEVRAQLVYTAPELTAGALYIRTEHADNTVSVTNAVAVSLANASPGIFAFAGDEPRPGMAFRDDQPVSAETPVSPGDLVKLWTTGLHVVGEPGTVTAGVPFGSEEIAVAPLTALVNGQGAEVVNVTLPATSIGVYEVVLRLPHGDYADNMARIVLAEDGVSSNIVTLPITH